LFEHLRPNRHRREDFTSDRAYEVYLKHRWDVEPTVEQEGLQWRVTWNDGDELQYEPPLWVYELCRLASNECLASTIFFDTGVTPNGRPWAKQAWWRVRLWLAYQQGQSDKLDADDEGS
jgi:hypothetical protein